MDSLLAHEAGVRFYLLLAGFASIAVWEARVPRRRPLPAARGRWGVNIALTLVLSVVVAVAFPLLAVGVAVAAEQRGIGALHRVAAPAWIEFALAWLLLDLGRYAQHALLHRVPALWRLHRVHHSDLDYDCTTALRFHPLEALFTVALHVALVAVLGASPLAVLAYEAIGALGSLFSHGNIGLPQNVDRMLRTVLVTPDMHRVHHSALAREQATNFGSLLPWWDRLFRTYCAQPQQGHAHMAIGLVEVRDARVTRLGWLLAWPFAARQRRVARSDGTA